MNDVNMIDIREQLEEAGFSFHNGNDPGEIIDGHWWCWCGPLGKWNVVAGETCSSRDSAIANAVAYLINYTIDCQLVLDEAGIIA